MKDEQFNYLKTITPLEATYNLIEATETFDCSTTICESSFSTLKRIGDVSRISMSCDRLKNLTFLAFEQRHLKKIDNTTILKKINSRKNRRVQLF